MITYDFQDAVFGDTFNEVQFTMLWKNGDPIDLTNVRIDIWFRRHTDKGEALKKLSTADDSIIKVDATHGIFKTAKFVVDFPAGVYLYDVKFYFIDSDDPRTYITGKANILQNITNPSYHE